MLYNKPNISKNYPEKIRAIEGRHYLTYHRKHLQNLQNIRPKIGGKTPFFENHFLFSPMPYDITKEFWSVQASLPENSNEKVMHIYLYSATIFFIFLGLNEMLKKFKDYSV